MILTGLNVPFKEIDITVRGNEDQRDFMREKAQPRIEGIVLPPQILYNDEYLGVSHSSFNKIFTSCLGFF